MNRRSVPLTALLLTIGVLVRVWLVTFEHNYDMQSWWVVAQAAAAKQNIYATTPRYTTGPMWFVVLGWLQRLPPVAGDPLLSLRIKINALLTVTDVGIALLLRRRYGLNAMGLFILNPIGVLITGYHLQFDNLAILLGLLAATVVEAEPREEAGSWLLALGLLGLSLATKHVLFAMPFWLAFQATTLRARVLRLAIPYGIFSLSFAPFWAGGRDGIVNNVLLYESFKNGPLWTALLPTALRDALPTTILFVCLMVLVGALVRRRSMWELTMLYTVIVLVLSSALANQYLSIPLAAISVYMNAPFLAYSVLGAAHIAGSYDGLGVRVLRPPGEVPHGLTVLGYGVLVIALTAGLGIMLWRESKAARVK